MRSQKESIQEGRAGSIVLAVEPDGDNITLGVTIEQSDNLVEWTKLNGEMTRTIPIPDGKKFYRFALDKQQNFKSMKGCKFNQALI